MKINIGTYSLGLKNTLTLPEKFQLAGEIGYDGLELMAGDLKDHTAEELSGLAAEYGLELVSVHAPLDAFDDIIDNMVSLGIKKYIVPYYAMASRKEALELAEKLNALQKRAESFGVSVGYHNHSFEFRKDGEEVLLETVLDNTDPGVFMQLDCGWVACGGADCPSFIRKYSGRVRSIHCKEACKGAGFDGKNSECPMGSPDSQLDWQAVLDAAREQKNGEVLWIVEREWAYRGTIQECLREDLSWLRAKLS